MSVELLGAVYLMGFPTLLAYKFWWGSKLGGQAFALAHLKDYVLTALPILPWCVGGLVSLVCHVQGIGGPFAAIEAFFGGLALSLASMTLPLVRAARLRLVVETRCAVIAASTSAPG